MLRLLLELAQELEKAGREAASPDEGVAGRGMTEPPGSGSPWALPPVAGGSIRRPPGADSPFSWP
jgi:hypothetical protein